MIGRESPTPIRGWLLVLCLLLMVWQPLSLALVASSVFNRLAMRGLPFAVILLLRLVVTAFGIAAGIALFARRPAAATLAKLSLALSAATDVFVYTTPYFPNNRLPGDAKYLVMASLAYHAVWLTYVFRSRRVAHITTDVSDARLKLG